MGTFNMIWRDERVRFLAVGGFNTLFGFIAYTLLYLLFSEHFHYLVLAVISHFVSVSVAFAMYRWHVFISDGAVLPEFIRYNMAVIANLGFGLVVLALLVDYVGWHPIISQGTVLVTVVVGNYFMHKYFTFRK